MLVCIYSTSAIILNSDDNFSDYLLFLYKLKCLLLFHLSVLSSKLRS